MPELCTVSGIIYDANGVAKVGAYLTVVPTGINGTLLHKGSFPVTSEAGGVVSFVVIQSAQYRIEGVGVLGFESGLTITIPASSTANLVSLVASSLTPSTGLTIKQGGVSFASLVGTFNFNADDFELSNSPTGQLNISIAAESLVNPMSAVGDSLYGGASGAATRLAGNVTTTRKFLRQTGDGAASAAPAWDTITASDLPTGIDAAKIGGGLVSSTEYDFLNGVTSAIQTQINTKAATTYVDSAIASLVAASPSTLDTLNEIAAALGNDANLSGTLTASIATKAAKASNLSDLADPSAARTNLGLAIGSNVQAFNQNLADIAGLADPNADKLLFWDDSAGAHKYLTLGTNLSITDTTLNAAGGGGGADTALSNLASVAINADLLPASTQSLGSASFPFLSSFIGNTTQYESVLQSAGLITHAALGSATNISLALTPKGTGQVLIPVGTGTASLGVPGLAFTGATNSGFSLGFTGSAGSNPTVWHAGGAVAAFHGTGAFGIRLAANYLTWAAGTDPTAAAVAGIALDATAGLQVMNGVANQWGYLKVGTRDASVSAITNGLTVGHLHSSSTPAAGMGSGILFNINSSTTADQNAGQIAAVWTTATHASRTADIVFNTVNGAAALAQAMRLKGDSRLIVGAPNSAPTDGDIANSFFTAYLDESANKLMFRVRYSDGTLKTAELALT